MKTPELIELDIAIKFAADNHYAPCGVCHGSGLARPEEIEAKHLRSIVAYARYRLKHYCWFCCGIGRKSETYKHDDRRPFSDQRLVIREKTFSNGNTIKLVRDRSKTFSVEQTFIDGSARKMDCQEDLPLAKEIFHELLGG